MATLIELEPHLAAQKEEGIQMAKAENPDFVSATEAIDGVRAILLDRDPSTTRTVLVNRLNNDLAVVDVRTGLYAASHLGVEKPTAAALVLQGRNDMLQAYFTTKPLLHDAPRELIPSIKAHMGATQKCAFQATQSLQGLMGLLSAEKRADQAMVSEQWMLGRGRTGEDGQITEAGAYSNGKEGDDKYWSTQTCFIGVRGEVANGGFEHRAKALKWLARGIPELSKAILFDASRQEAVLTAGRLTLESLSRSRALAAILDYRLF